MNAISTQAAIPKAKDASRYAGTGCNLDAKRVRVGGCGVPFNKRLLFAKVHRYFFVDNGRECTPGAFLMWNGIQTGSKTGICMEDIKEALNAYVDCGMLAVRKEAARNKMITDVYSKAS